MRKELDKLVADFIACGDSYEQAYHVLKDVAKEIKAAHGSGISPFHVFYSEWYSIGLGWTCIEVERDDCETLRHTIETALLSGSAEAQVGVDISISCHAGQWFLSVSNPHISVKCSEGDLRHLADDLEEDNLDRLEAEFRDYCEEEHEKHLHRMESDPEYADQCREEQRTFEQAMKDNQV